MALNRSQLRCVINALIILFIIGISILTHFSYPKIKSSNVFIPQFIIENKRQQPPILVNIEQIPSEVQYFNPVNITVVVINGSTIVTMQLYYRVDVENWLIVEMINNTVDLYFGFIPQQTWNSLVEYYVNATDYLGASIIDDNQGNYYNYTVIDTISPNLTILSPRAGEHLSGELVIEFFANDDGSGVQITEAYIDDVLVGSANSGNYGRGTIHVSEGSHSVAFKAVDFAGNEVIRAVNIEVTNITTVFPITGFPFEAVVIGLFLTIWLVHILRRRKS